jgi:hypothetical protein
MFLHLVEALLYIGELLSQLLNFRGGRSGAGSKVVVINLVANQSDYAECQNKESRTKGLERKRKPSRRFDSGRKDLAIKLDSCHGSSLRL